MAFSSAAELAHNTGEFVNHFNLHDQIMIMNDL